MSPLSKPRALRPGARIGIAAPGGPVDPERVAAGCRLLEQAGFRTFRREDLVARRGYLAGDDQRRIDELEQLWSAPDIDAIVCARGGYGCDRILARLDPALAREARKPLVGYSDATALLLWQRRAAGLAGFHGPMLERGADLDPGSLAALLGWLTGAPLPEVALHGCGAFPGEASGPLVGGSLTLVVASLGTPWEIETQGCVLLLEEVNERPYRVDRMLQQLQAAGKLGGLAGIGFGDLASCTDDRYGSCVEDVVRERVDALGIPAVTGLPFGHVPVNTPWPVGVRATIDGSRGEVRILERGVEVTS